MKIYDIKLADGDTIRYHSDKTIDELKEWIATNDFIELPRVGAVPYGTNGWRNVPKLASYQTKSIVYINHNVELEQVCEYNQKIIDEHKPVVDKIFQYEFNRRMQLWLKWNVSECKWSSDDEELKEKLYFLSDEYLNSILVRCKKYKCKLKLTIG